MREIKVATTYNLMVFMNDSTDLRTGKTGLTLNIGVSKNGAAFNTITPTVTERGNGWYNLALTASHTDTVGDLAFHITATGADPSDLICIIVFHKAYGISKNTALSNFTFLMVDSADHVTPKTGLTITAERSIDGAAFSACANSASAIGNGMYKINLENTDLNGDNIILRFTATGSDPRLVTIITEP
jgi:hypothetical protein